MYNLSEEHMSTNNSIIKHNESKRVYNTDTTYCKLCVVVE